MQRSPKILEQAELKEIREKLRKDGSIVVQCHGCFDIVHPGHIRYLRYAKSLGDVLVVSVTGDQYVDKGFDRPYVREELRVENLASLEFVDYVCIDNHARAWNVLDLLRPDIYVKGKEYETKPDPRFAKEKELVEAYGGKVIFSSGDVVFSSSHIIEQLRGQLRIDREKIDFFCRTYDVTSKALEEVLDKFSDARILVIGDPILDHYIHCEEMNIAAESPIISVAPVEEQWFAGGAGLIAKQMARLGASVSLITTLDESDRAVKFRGLLDEDGVEVVSVQTKLRPMFIKTRYLVEKQKVFRVNEGRRSPLPSSLVGEFRQSIDQRLDGYDMMIVTDFGYGLFGAELIDAINRLSRKRKTPFAVDVNRAGSPNLVNFEKPRLATPTEEELRFAFGDLESGLSHLAARYYKTTGAERLMLTLDKRGAILFTNTDRADKRLITDYLPAFNSRPIDPVGAGDVFLCAAVLCESLGFSAHMGLYLGNALAALHISELGNEPMPLSLFREYVARRPEFQTSA